jgi:hypothetical protein
MDRLGLWPWIGLGLLLTAAQVGAVAPTVSAAPGWLAVGVAAAVALQIVKAWLSALRLRDQGRDPSRAVFTAIPPLNFFLIGALLEPAPAPQERARRMALWQGRRSALSAVRFGLSATVRASALVLPLCAVQGLLVGWLESSAPGALAALLQGDLGVLTNTFQGVLFVFGSCGLYLIVQVIKRRTASRVSWLPTLLVVPTGLLALGLYPGLLQILGVGAMVAVAYGAVGLAVWVFLGGVLQPVFIHVAASAAARDGRPDLGAATAAWRAVAVESLVVHGAVATVIFLGLQALFVPGFALAVALAYAVHAATLDRAPHPFRASRRLTTGDASRPLAILAGSLLLSLVVQIGAHVAVEWAQSAAGASEFVVDGQFLPGRVIVSSVTALVYPGGVRVPVVGVALSSAIGAWIGAVALSSLTILYVERRAG